MRVLRLEGGEVRKGGKELVGPGAPMWIDLDPSPENLAFLAETFRFHPLALEDCAHENQRVKFDQYSDHLFVVVHRIIPSPDESTLLPLELHAFVTTAAVVTVHSAPIAEVDRVFARCAMEPDLLGRGPDFALYLVHDAITDAHYTLVDALAEDVEELADNVHHARRSEESEDLLDRITHARRTHSLLRKRLGPQREVFATLARPGQPLVREQTAIYYRDVVDHAVRVTEEVDAGRELLASTMDALLSHQGNRLGIVTTRLTLVATIFLPLNFVAGFFGMNLDIVPQEVAIPIVLGLMTLVPVGMWAIFRKRGLL
jgi:magnesium transporter